MKISYEIDEELSDDEIIIKVKALKAELLELEKLLNNKTIKESTVGYIEKEMFPIKIRNIDKIYTQARKVYILSEEKVYESRKSLSDMEATFPSDFVRISKGVIVNINGVKSIEAEFSGNLRLKLNDGSQESLSRKYVKDFKRAIGMEA